MGCKNNVDRLEEAETTFKARKRKPELQDLHKAKAGWGCKQVGAGMTIVPWDMGQGFVGPHFNPTALTPWLHSGNTFCALQAD